MICYEAERSQTYQTVTKKLLFSNLNLGKVLQRQQFHSQLQDNFFPVTPPIAVSKPHFLGAAPEILHMFPRMKQNIKDDEVSVDIEPVTKIIFSSWLSIFSSWLSITSPKNFCSVIIFCS